MSTTHGLLLPLVCFKYIRKKKRQFYPTLSKNSRESNSFQLILMGQNYFITKTRQKFIEADYDILISWKHRCKNPWDDICVLNCPIVSPK